MADQLTKKNVYVHAIGIWNIQVINAQCLSFRFPNWSLGWDSVENIQTIAIFLKHYNVYTMFGTEKWDEHKTKTGNNFTFKRVFKYINS